MSRRPNGGTLRSIFQRDKGRCWICGHKVRHDEASRDHVEPRSLGGYDKSRNYRLAHDRCNNARGNLSEQVVAAIRESLPHAPSEVIRAALNAAKSQRRVRP